jgi:exoribonuclease-2
LAQSFLVEFDVERNIVRREIKPGIITVSRRLTYEEVDSLLCDEQAPDDDVVRDLLSLWDVASAYEGHRLERGAYQFARKEVWPALDESGVIRLETAQEETPARKLVSELMVLANETAALFAREQGLPMLFRTQEPPEEVSEERVMAVPEGPARDYVARSGLKRSLLSTEPLVHSGLGLDAYVHVTSPIRRYIDLVNQRQLMARLEGQSEFYRAKELAEAGAQVDTSLGEARTIQRDRTRYWLMKYIRQEKIKELEAVVVKVDGPRPLAEVSLFAMMFPFRNQAHGAKTKRKPGDRITLRVRDVDPLRDILTLVDAD